MGRKTKTTKLTTNQVKRYWMIGLVTWVLGMMLVVSWLLTPIKIRRGETAGACVRAGCSGQLCVSKENFEEFPFATTCEWREVYSCQQMARCVMQENGLCGLESDLTTVSCRAKTSARTNLKMLLEWLSGKYSL